MNCCKSYHCKNNISSSYIKWLLELLGPVLMGSKPSEIISIPYYDINKDNKIKEINNHFSKCRKINYIIIDKENKGLKVLFINNNSLIKTLSCKKCQSFLRFLGYPKDITLDSCLSHLITKIKGDFFPDEIGIFLGYPIKDVVGFMGYGNYKSYNTKYWRVYGDPKPSEDLYSKFLYHRNKMRQMLSNNNIEFILSLF